MKRSNKIISGSEESESESEISEVIEDVVDFYDENYNIDETEIQQENEDYGAIECSYNIYFLNYLLILIFYIIFITI
jgi:hypothetical protein